VLVGADVVVVDGDDSVVGCEEHPAHHSATATATHAADVVARTSA
jgi:hypothetical protein